MTGTQILFLGIIVLVLWFVWAVRKGNKVDSEAIYVAPAPKPVPSVVPAPVVVVTKEAVAVKIAKKPVANLAKTRKIAAKKVVKA